MDVKSWVPVDFYKTCQSNGTFSMKYLIQEIRNFLFLFVCFCFESEVSVFRSGKQTSRHEIMLLSFFSRDRIAFSNVNLSIKYFFNKPNFTIWFYIIRWSTFMKKDPILASCLTLFLTLYSNFKTNINSQFLQILKKWKKREKEAQRKSIFFSICESVELSWVLANLETSLAIFKLCIRTETQPLPRDSLERAAWGRSR